LTTQDAERMTIRLAALAAFVIVGLAGCAPPTPLSTPTAAPPVIEPSPTATPEPVVPAELVVLSSGVELYDSEGAMVGSFAWADETATALALLETAFGPVPVPSIRAGDGTHYPDFEAYDFAGIIYFSAIGLEKPRTEYFLPATVQVNTGSPINGVSVRTAAGLRVGATLADVLALTPELNYPHPLGTAYLIDPVDPALVSDPMNYTDMVAAVVDAAGTLRQLVAPYQSRTLF